MFFKGERRIGVDEVDPVLDLQAVAGEIPSIEPPHDRSTAEAIGELLGEHVKQILKGSCGRSGTYTSILAFSDSDNELLPPLAKCLHALQDGFCGQLHALPWLFQLTPCHRRKPPAKTQLPMLAIGSPSNAPGEPRPTAENVRSSLKSLRCGPSAPAG
jgi:hypothetical protein